MSRECGSSANRPDRCGAPDLHARPRQLQSRRPALAADRPHVTRRRRATPRSPEPASVHKRLSIPAAHPPPPAPPRRGQLLGPDPLPGPRPAHLGQDSDLLGRQPHLAVLRRPGRVRCPSSCSLLAPTRDHRLEARSNVDASTDGTPRGRLDPSAGGADRATMPRSTSNNRNGTLQPTRRAASASAWVIHTVTRAALERPDRARRAPRLPHVDTEGRRPRGLRRDHPPLPPVLRLPPLEQQTRDDVLGPAGQRHPHVLRARMVGHLPMLEHAFECAGCRRASLRSPA